MSAADRARGLVADWTLLLVRGLPDRIARDRFDEIASDLWEQQHDAEGRGVSSIRIALAVLVRASRGVPADLAWRWSVVRAVPFGGASPRTTAARAWIPLADAGRPFDQTNGIVELGGDPDRDRSNPERDLLEMGVRMNSITFGVNGGM